MCLNSLKKRIYSAATLLFLFSSSLTHAQIDAAAEVSVRGMGATTGDLPFWMHSRQRGRVLKESNFMGLVQGKALHTWGESSVLEAGGGVFYEDARDALKLDELYLGYRNDWFRAVVGRKQREELYDGLSASNESILRSLNARPLPGIQLGTARPLFVLPSAGIGFEVAWEEYLMEEERDMRNARLHHKSLHLVFQPVAGFQLKAGLQHYVQWAGTSERYGKQPSSFEDYLRILAGRGGGESATIEDKENALGNNLGSYEVLLKLRLKHYDISLLWNSIFEDGSGMRLGNTPDGRYGLFVKQREPKGWFRSAMYEFYYTKHQSHTTTGPHKYDNFFNNITYTSGWTYEGQVIGVPFFTPRASGRGMANNVFTAHHLGLSGVAFDWLPFRMLTSYRRNYGISNGSYTYFSMDPPQEVFSSLLELNLPLRYFQLQLQLGSDFSNFDGPNFGAGLGVSYGL